MSCIQHCIFNYGVDITSQYCWYCQFVLCMHAPRNRHAPLSIRKLRAQVVDHATVLFVASILGFWIFWGDFTGFKRFRGFWDMGMGQKLLLPWLREEPSSGIWGVPSGYQAFDSSPYPQDMLKILWLNLPVMSNDLPIFLMVKPC